MIHDTLPIQRSGNMEFVKDVHAMILNHLDLPHTLDSLAAQAGVSVSKLQRSFRRTYSISVIAFIRRERLVRAKQQIEVTTMSIKTVARQAGYRSIPAFTAAFSSEFKISPGLLRKSI